MKRARQVAGGAGCRQLGVVRSLVVALVGLWLGLQSSIATAQTGSGEWRRWQTAEEAGFSGAQLESAEQQWNSLADAPMAAMVIVFKGRILTAWGDITANYQCHSARKSLLSALYGIHIEKGAIDVDRTLGELGIDDSTPLTESELQATVLDLLMARSGVYLPAACETQEMRDARPARGSHPPGTFWYYNNWDFNALGTIFRQETGRDIFREFQRRIARPIGMQDFSVSRCEYYFEREYSDHPCYVFRMSARDRARFGQLFLQRGRWGRRQVIPAAWVDESTRPISNAGPAAGDPGVSYGLMWWNLSRRFFRSQIPGSPLRHLSGYAASGFGGQWIMVLPDAEIVMATACDVPAGCYLEGFEWGPIFESVLTAREVVDLRVGKPQVDQRIVSRGATLQLAATIKNLSTSTASLATTVEAYLSSERSTGSLTRLATIALDPLAARDRARVRFSALVPQGIASGRYRIVVAVDSEKTNYDLRRSNNIGIGRQTIEIQ